MKKLLTTIALLSLGSLLFAGEPRIPAGFDTWETLGGGLTYMSFEEEPIPADFFCEGCAAFTGRISIDGVPLATDPPGLFGRTDTIIERLDEAVFEGDTAFSRIRVKAMHLIADQPLYNPGGAWDITVGLTPDQPVTTVDYTKKNANSGVFNAELVLNVRLTFTNQDGDVRSIDRTVHFNGFDQAPYTLLDPAAPTRFGKRADGERGMVSFMVDTDADGQPDSPMSFARDSLRYLTQQVQFDQMTEFELLLWHEAPTHEHSTRSTSIDSDGGKLGGLTAGLDQGTSYGPIERPAGDIDTAKLMRKVREMERKGLLTQPFDEVITRIIQN